MALVVDNDQYQERVPFSRKQYYSIFFCLTGYDSAHTAKSLPTFGRNKVPPPPKKKLHLMRSVKFLGGGGSPTKLIKPKVKPQITKSFALVVSEQFTTLFLGSHFAASTRLLPTVQLWLSLQAAHFSLQQIPLFRQIA